MTKLIEAATYQIYQIGDEEEVFVEAKLSEISNLGDILIKFDPPIVSIPNDWDRLWDIEEREKLSLKDRKIFEEELKKIMHIQFVLNSEELP